MLQECTLSETYMGLQYSSERWIPSNMKDGGGQTKFMEKEEDSCAVKGKFFQNGKPNIPQLTATSEMAHSLLYDDDFMASL